MRMINGKEIGIRIWSRSMGMTHPGHNQNRINAMVEIQELNTAMNS